MIVTRSLDPNGYRLELEFGDEVCLIAPPTGWPSVPLVELGAWTAIRKNGAAFFPDLGGRSLDELAGLWWAVRSPTGPNGELQIMMLAPNDDLEQNRADGKGVFFLNATSAG